MSETPQSTPEDQRKMSRRQFLRWGAKATGVVAGAAILGELGVDVNRVNAQEVKETSEIIAGIEAMSLDQLEAEVFENYPVIPEIAPIADRINQIARIPEGSYIMKAGTSVSRGILESIYSVDPNDINLRNEQYKVNEVLEHCQIPQDALEACTVEGADVDQLLYEPLFCRGPMHCPPNTSVVDAYIDYYDPKASINFIGTNMVRNGYTLEEFANSTEEMINHYIDKGVIPILTTFPQPPNSTDEEYRVWFNEPVPIVHPGQNEQDVIQSEIEYRSSYLPENALKYNVLLLKLAEKHQIPIINTERGVVEMAKGNGTVQPNENWSEIDPQHFSSKRHPESLTLPDRGSKFETGEEAVSYFTVQTLYEILAHQS